MLHTRVFTITKPNDTVEKQPHESQVITDTCTSFRGPGTHTDLCLDNPEIHAPTIAETKRKSTPCRICTLALQFALSMIRQLSVKNVLVLFNILKTAFRGLGRKETRLSSGNISRFEHTSAVCKIVSQICMQGRGPRKPEIWKCLIFELTFLHTQWEGGLIHKFSNPEN